MAIASQQGAQVIEFRLGQEYEYTAVHLLVGTDAFRACSGSRGVLAVVRGPLLEGMRQAEHLRVLPLRAS